MRKLALGRNRAKESNPRASAVIHSAALRSQTPQGVPAGSLCCRPASRTFAWVWLCVAVCFVESGRAAVHEAAVLAEFDMAFDENGAARLIVDVTFAGEEYRFEIDTGSSSTEFDVHLAPILRRRDGTSFHWAPGELLTGETYMAPTGFIGSLPLPRLEGVTCRNLNQVGIAEDQKTDGILGMDALHSYIIALDFDRGKISFLRSVPPTAGTRLQVAEAKKAPTVTALLGKGSARNFIVDTGYNCEVAVARTEFDALLARGQVSLAGTRTARTAAGLFSCRLGVLVGSLTVGGYAHSGVAIAELPDSRLPTRIRRISGLESIDAPNVLGRDYLSRYLVIFDFPHHAMYLRPGTTFRALRAPVMLAGVRLARDGDSVSILSVRAGTRAAGHAQPDDVLETINGTRVDGLPDSDVVRLLMDASVERTLTFRRRNGSCWEMELGAMPAPSSTAPATSEVKRDASSDPPAKAGTPGNGGHNPVRFWRRRLLR
jgi:hypothetical protein